MRSCGIPICTIDGCDKPYRSKGFCNGHYKRWLRHGDPLAGNTRGATIMERFARAVDNYGQPGVCWLWKASTDRKGYGRFWNGEKRTDRRPVMVPAHRWAYERFNGEITTGLHVLHKCDVPGCVNPDHLFLGTNADNAADCVVKGRRPLPKTTKLTPAQVLEIKNRHESQRQLAREYGVGCTTIGGILRGQTWQSLAAQGALASIREQIGA